MAERLRFEQEMADLGLREYEFENPPGSPPPPPPPASEAETLKLAIQSGVRDPNDLTNRIFFARHPELPPAQPLDPQHPRFKQLSAEWSAISNTKVWKAITDSAENTDLKVSGAEAADHQRFFRGKNGKKLKQVVENAAAQAGINPGLLGAIMMAETRRPNSYVSNGKVRSYHIGVDDFYIARGSIASRVPAYAGIRWDKGQTPEVHDNDSLACKKKAQALAAGNTAEAARHGLKCRQVKTILFDSGPDGALATAVYLKFIEVRLQEIGLADFNGDFSKLPITTKFALTRMAMGAGLTGVKPFLKDALSGTDIFVRKNIRVKARQTKRNATVRTAQAMHLSEWVFGIPVPAVGPPPASVP